MTKKYTNKKSHDWRPISKASSETFNERVSWLELHSAKEIDVCVDKMNGDEYIENSDGERVDLPPDIRMEDIELDLESD